MKPGDAWSWPATLIVSVLAAGPPLVAARFTPYGEDLGRQADIVGFFLYPVLLAAAVLLYFHWRLTDRIVSARLASVLCAGAVQGLSMGTLRIGYPDALNDRLLGLALVDIAWAVAALVLVTSLAGRWPRWDPGVVGVALGVSVTLLRVGIVAVPGSAVPGLVLLAGLDLLLLGLNLALAVAVLRLRPLPPWVRGRLAFAVLLLSINRALAYPLLDGDWLHAGAIVTDLAGAILLCDTVLTLLRRTVRRRRQEIDGLLERIHVAEDGVLGNKERLHEIRATVAGIACASRLSHDDTVPLQRREQLDDMVSSEIDRLSRLMEDRERDLREVAVDDVVGPIVTAQCALGQQVRWSATGLRLRTRADNLAEVVHILLDNAATHAPGAAVTVTAQQDPEAVAIRVQDDGPGIPEEIAPWVFGHGWRREDSPGQGIGLSMAVRLADEMGGDLSLLHGSRPTTFVLRMPLKRSTHEPADSAS